MTKAEELASELMLGLFSKPELLPESPENVTWNTPGVGSIDIDEFAQRIIAALHEYGAIVRKRDAEVVEGFVTGGADPATITYWGVALAKSIAAKELP